MRRAGSRHGITDGRIPNVAFLSKKKLEKRIIRFGFFEQLGIGAPFYGPCHNDQTLKNRQLFDFFAPSNTRT